MERETEDQRLNQPFLGEHFGSSGLECQCGGG